MINSRILDDDPESGKRTIHHFDYATGKTTIEVRHEVEPLIEINKALFNETDKHTSFRGRDMVRMASIPIGVWMELKKKGIVDDDKAYRRWLNDSENRFFRTTAGRV